MPLKPRPAVPTSEITPEHTALLRVVIRDESLQLSFKYRMLELFAEGFRSINMGYLHALSLPGCAEAVVKSLERRNRELFGLIADTPTNAPGFPALVDEQRQLAHVLADQLVSGAFQPPEPMDPAFLMKGLAGLKKKIKRLRWTVYGSVLALAFLLEIILELVLNTQAGIMDGLSGLTFDLLSPEECRFLLAFALGLLVSDKLADRIEHRLYHEALEEQAAQLDTLVARYTAELEKITAAWKIERPMLLAALRSIRAD